MMMPLLSQSMDLETQLSPLGTILKDVRAHYSPNREDRAEPCVKFCELTAAIQKPATCSTGRLGQHVAIDIGTGIDIGMAMDGYRNRCITTNTVIDMEDRENLQSNHILFPSCSTQGHVLRILESWGLFSH